MHIVLSGYYGFDNVGDEAILFSIIRALRHLDNNIDITVLSNNPQETRKTYGVQAVNRWNFREVRAAIKHADGLISGGGSLLQDQTGLKSIPYYAGIMQLAVWLKKPVFVYAQGMGPIQRVISKWIVRHVLNKVNQITVRDEGSKRLLEEIGVKDKENIHVVPDPVLGLDAVSFMSDRQFEKNSYITVSVRDWESDINFKSHIAQCLDELVRMGEQVVFVPMHNQRDYRTSREVAGMMKEKSHIAPFNDSIEGKIATISRSKMLLGMRLHSLIFAAVGNIPFVALSYDPKIDAFASICDQPVAGHVNASNWDSDSLLLTIQDVLNHYPEKQKIITNKVASLKVDAIHTAEKALETFR